MPNDLKPCWMILFLKNILFSRKYLTIFPLKIAVGAGRNNAGFLKIAECAAVIRIKRLIFVFNVINFHAAIPILMMGFTKDGYKSIEKSKKSALKNFMKQQ